MQSSSLRFPFALAALLPVLFAALTLSGCGGERVAKVEDLNTREVRLPDGSVVVAEVLLTAIEQQRGMMFRDSLPAGRGMLFVHDREEPHSYWMYQVKVPLDIIWLDKSGRVVEISENTPPCQTEASKCPNYGGNSPSLVVLEVPGGYARAHGVKVGEVIRY